MQLLLRVCTILSLSVFLCCSGYAEETSAPAGFEDKFVQLGEKGGHTIIVSEPGPKTETRFLDPLVVDESFDRYVGTRIASLVGDKKLAVSKIPGYDDALEEFGKVSPVSFELGFALVSKYIWRGQNLGDRANWQPYVKAGTKFLPLGTASFTYWVDFLKDGNEEIEDSPADIEHDFYFDYNFDLLAAAKLAGIDYETMPYLLKKAVDLNFAIGIWRYWYPTTLTSTNELYGTVTYNWPFHPFVTLVNDFSANTGMWLETGICQNFDLKLFTVSFYSKLGYNDRQYCSSSKLQTLEFGFSLPIPLGTHMKIEPFISYSKRLNKTYFYTEVEQTELDADGNEVTTTVQQGNILTRDEFFGGFKYAINF